MYSKLLLVLSTGAGVAVLAACTSIDGPSYPSSILPREAEAIGSQQGMVIGYIAKYENNYDKLPSENSPGWYEIAKGGFNVVGAKCDDYLGKLYNYEHSRQQTSSILASLSSASTTILSLNDVSKAAIGTLAAIFGLAASANDALAEGYLQLIGQNVVGSTVSKLQQAYASQFSAANVKSQADAIAAIRGYLQICTPVYLESQITSYVAKAGAQPVDSGATPSPPVTPPKATAKAQVVAPALTSPNAVRVQLY